MGHLFVEFMLGPTVRDCSRARVRVLHLYFVVRIFNVISAGGLFSGIFSSGTLLVDVLFVGVLARTLVVRWDVVGDLSKTQIGIQTSNIWDKLAQCFCCASFIRLRTILLHLEHSAALLTRFSAARESNVMPSVNQRSSRRVTSTSASRVR